MEIIKNIFDAYSLKARLAPSLSVVLFFAFIYFKYIKINSIGGNGYQDILPETAIGVCTMFVFASFIRSIGKFVIEELMFKGKLNMPTTLLLFNESQNLISKNKKDQILKFFKDDLQIDIDERKQLLEGHPNELKKEISESIAILVNKTRENELLFRSNQTYGLWRNLSGAISLTIFILLVLFIVNIFTTLLSNQVIIIYLLGTIIAFIISLILTRKYAYEYANILFTILIDTKK